MGNSVKISFRHRDRGGFPFVALLITLLLCAGFNDDLLSQSRPFSNSHFTTINGLKLHYRVWEPSKENLVGNVFMVHGFGGSTFSWQGVADSLQQLGYRAVAIDVPPFGFSDRAPRQNHSVTARASLLIALLEQEFPGTTWHLAGHSMGGGIVQAMALMEPSLFESVNFVAATLFSSIKPGSRQSPLWMSIPGLTSFAGNIAESWIINRSRIEQLLTSAYGQNPSPEQVEGYLLPLQVPGTARSILHMQRFNKELTELDAKALSIPALAIWGENDTWVSLQSRKSILEQIYGVQLRVIKQAGHNPMETHFKEFIDIYIAFLDNL
ncbi:MAG: alpha/beta hydrolase [Bacteroidetes bacterium]|nr:MAG: alpha/beta hydrolase [Bacteroidota bacterium]